MQKQPISTYIFCQCMKPWKLCINKPKSYKLDIRDLLNIWSINRYIFTKKAPLSLNYDFVNMKPLTTKFVCRFDDKPRH